MKKKEPAEILVESAIAVFSCYLLGSWQHSWEFGLGLYLFGSTVVSAVKR